MLWSEAPSQNLREGRTAYWNVEQWRSQSKSFADMAFFDGVSATLTTADRAEKISVLRTSPNLFPLLGVQSLHGRIFTAEEAEQKGKTSHKWWYAVSTLTGQVLHEYRTSSVPRTWLKEYRRSGREIAGRQ